MRKAIASSKGSEIYDGSVVSPSVMESEQYTKEWVNKQQQMINNRNLTEMEDTQARHLETDVNMLKRTVFSEQNN